MTRRGETERARLRRLSRQVTAEAIDQVDLHTELAWRRMAEDALACVLARGVVFSADDVWFLLEDWDVPQPRENRAMGPVMATIRKRATKVGYALSVRPCNHRRPVMRYLPIGKEEP